jgi:hypothetical protein
VRGLLLAAVLLVLAGGAVWAASPPGERRPAKADRGERSRSKPNARPPRQAPKPRRVAASRCPAELQGCRSVRGRIVYVERVDPDGDGDLHVVVTGGGITLAGVTAIDVEKYLRPRRDPRIGDEASAAGQVFRGSYGQRQIQAVEFHVRRR